jgi:hypothetical protein
LVSHDASELAAGLGADPVSHRASGEPPGLGVPDLTSDSTSQLEAHLGQLRRLPGAGLTSDDDDLVVANRGGDLVSSVADRQLRRIGDPGYARPAGGDSGLRPRERVGDIGQCLGAPSLIPNLPDPVEPASQRALVAKHGGRQPLAQGADRRRSGGCHTGVQDRQRGVG